MPKNTPVRIIDQPYVGLGGSKVTGSGIRPGSGGGITIHSELSGRTAGNSHPISAITNLQTELDLRVQWKGDWSSALTYQANDWVLDGGYGMIANKTTTDTAAPLPQGEESYLYAGSSPTTSSNAKQLIQGARYESSQPIFVNGYRIYTIAGNEYDVYTRDESGKINQVLKFTASSTGWVQNAITPVILPANDPFFMYAISTEPDPTPTTWAGDWNYTTPNNPTTPGAGVISHSNKELGILRVNKTDGNGGDRSAELEALGIGDTISGADMSWNIQSVTDNGATIAFAVSPSLQGTAGVSTFSFETVTATPIEYVMDVGYWAGDPAVQGILGIDIPVGSITPDANQYGIDLLVQELYLSPDWDIAYFPTASSGGGTSSGGGGGDTHDPVTSPLGTIQVGGAGGQEIEVNQDYNFGFGGNVTFTNPIDAPGVTHDGNFEISLSPTGYILTDEVMRGSDNNTNINFATGAATFDHINTNVLADQDAGTGLTIIPSGDLMLYPIGDTLMDGIQRYKDFAGTGPGVYIDWTCETGSKFCELFIDNLTVQTFTLLDAQVANGQLIVGRSTGELSRNFTMPALDGQNTMVIYDVPGAGDMPAFRIGDTLTWFYYCEEGATVYDAEVMTTAHRYAARENEGGGANPYIQDFNATTLNQIPADWTGTGTGNSLVSDPTIFGAYDDATIDPTRMLKTNPDVGDDTNFHIHYTGAGYATKTNYEYTGRAYINALGTGYGMTVFSGYPNTDQYIRIRRNSFINSFHVNNHGYAEPTGGTTSTGFSPITRQWTYWKIQVEDDGVSRTTLKARFWNEAEDEPDWWMIDCYFDGVDRPTQGTFGLWSMESSGTAFATFDDLHVEDLGVTQAPPTVTVPMYVTETPTATYAIVTVDGGSDPTLPADFALKTYSYTNNALTNIYEYIGAPITTHTNFEWTSPNSEFLAVTMFMLTGTSGSGSNIGTVQSGGLWPVENSEVNGGDGYFELSFASSHLSAPGITETGVEPVANYSENEQYRHKITSLGSSGKPDNFDYNVVPGAEGATFTFSILSLTSQGNAAMGTAYAEVIAAVDDTTLDPPGDGEQAWTVQMTRSPAPGCVVQKGTFVFDIGVSGDSFWTANAIDPLSGGAYSGIVTWDGNPWDWVTPIRTGYLGGLPSQGDIGFWYSFGGASMELSEAIAQFTNINMQWSNSSGDRIAAITQNLGFTAYEHPNETADIRDWSKQNGYNLLADDSSVMGGLYGDHHPSTDTRVIRLTTHDFFSQPGSYATNMVAEVVANANVAGSNAQSRLWAFTGIDDGTIDTVRGAGGIEVNVSSADVVSIDVTGATTFDSVATYASGVEPSADQDLARIVDLNRKLDKISDIWILPSQVAGDTSMQGITYTRSVTTNAMITGSVMVTTTGPGTPAGATYLLVDGTTTIYTINDTDTGTTAIEIKIDMGANVNNFGHANWFPYLSARTDNPSYTYYNNILVEASTDNVNWYTSSGDEWSTNDFDNDRVGLVIWKGEQAQPGSLTTWRYVRFTLTDRVETAGYASKGTVWITQCGLAHVNAEAYPQYAKNYFAKLHRPALDLLASEAAGSNRLYNNGDGIVRIAQ